MYKVFNTHLDLVSKKIWVISNKTNQQASRHTHTYRGARITAIMLAGERDREGEKNVAHNELAKNSHRQILVPEMWCVDVDGG